MDVARVKVVEQIRVTRRECKRKLKEREKEKWETLIIECEKQDIEHMCNKLNQNGLRDYAKPSNMLSLIPAESLEEYLRKIKKTNDMNLLQQNIQDDLKRVTADKAEKISASRMNEMPSDKVKVVSIKWSK